MISVVAARDDETQEIRVMDQGPGIEADQAEIIFDRFESRSATSGKTGTGLGLSIVRGFLELHGGSVTIDTDYVDGTCFVCRIPVVPSTENLVPSGIRDRVLANPAVA